MKQLEDRIKDRLEGYESSLPEGDLAEFKALLDAASTSGAKRSPVYLAWLAPFAVAAGLALFFTLGHGPQQDIVQVAGGSSLVSDAAPASPAEVVGMEEAESIEDAAAVQADPVVIPGRTDKPFAAVEVRAEQENDDSASDVSEQSAGDQVGNVQQAGSNKQKGGEKRNEDDPSMSSSADYSPFVPSGSHSRKPVSVKVGRATAGVLGGTGALALASVLPSIMVRYDNDGMYYDADGLGGIYTDPEHLTDRRDMNDTHYMPLRAGLSMRIPFNERWSLTTGLDYSWYASELEYSHSGIHKQSVHYLGVPLRADLTIARNRWMDVYVGAGGSMDFCVAAYDAGQKTARDGVGFSLIGAGGIQFNISKDIGLFLDPTLSWDMTSGKRVLDTFRSEHPVMFSVSVGIRLSVPDKK